MAIQNAPQAAHIRAKIASGVARSERRENERSLMRRPLCDRCSRPPTICVCQGLPSKLIATDTRVLVLQHPAEFRRKTISTVPLMPLVLENCKIVVGYTFEAMDLAPIRDALSRGTVPLLLFPGADSISLDGEVAPNLDELGPIQGFPENENDNATDKSKSRLLILIDGTWSQAKNMVRDSPSLLACCQKVQFASKGNSIYDAIRTQPSEHCLSTLECCSQTLLYLEPDSANAHEAVTYLETALRTLVEQQQQMRLGPAPRHLKTRSAKLFAKNRRRFEIERELFSSMHRSIIFLEDGSMLRKLRHSDAPLVSMQWSRNNPTSIDIISRRIDIGDACFGIFRGHELCGFILQYENDVLGMLQVDEAYRRRGYGSALLAKATHELETKDVPCVAFIVDGNFASEGVFSRQGWIREDPTAKAGTGNRRAPRKWILQPTREEGVYTSVDDESKSVDERST
jgi:DTW domain-containing protein YfiP/GNAT superfamily N-acetyltransferase